MADSKHETPVFRNAKVDDGGLAFPGKRTQQVGWTSDYGFDLDGPDSPTFAEVEHFGMSLRAYIATKVIGGLCANPSIFQANDRSGWDLANCTEGQLADCAVRIADEMIISLKAGE